MADMIMDNLMKIARLKDLFKGDTLSDEKGQLPIQGQGQMPIPGKGMPASNAPSMLSDYNQNARAMPQYEKPRLLNRLFNAGSAVLTNLKTPQNTVPTYEALDQSGIERDTERWKQKGDQLYRGAVLEDREDDNRRNAEQIRLNNEIKETQNRLKEDELKRKEGEFEVKSKQKDQEIKIASDRAATYEKLSNGGQIVADKDGKTWMVYKDGTKEDVDLTQMSAAEKQKLANSGRLVILGAEQKGRETLEEQKHGNRMEEIGARGEETRTTNAMKPASKVNQTGTGTKNSELERMRKVYNNAQQALVQNPDWKKYITIEGPGKPVTVKTPSDSAFGFGKPDTATYNKIRQALGPEWNSDQKPNVKIMPPIGQRKKGDKWTFPNGKVGTWDGTDWVI